MNKKILIVGAGVTGIFASTKLLERGYPGHLITIIDKGKNPYERQFNEIMSGFLGAGLFSDGKICYMHNKIGGHLAKYCGEDKATDLINEMLDKIKKFHPESNKLTYSPPPKEPEFIKPYFELRVFPSYHIGTNYLRQIGKFWYDYLLSKGIKFIWNTKIDNIDFDKQKVNDIYYDKLIYATGKSGIDLTQKLIDKYKLETESKPIQIGVRFEAPQKYFQKILDVAYDFKLYKDYKDLSIRSFCVNSNASAVVEEKTFNMNTYNGHSFKDKDKINNMVNFGIMMEIKNIENPFEFVKKLTKNCQPGLYYSPSREPSINVKKITKEQYDNLNAFGEYKNIINQYIHDLDKIFQFGDDWGIYIPEVKHLTDEVIVNYNDLSLIKFPNVHFGGDALSARGIAVSAAHGLLIAEGILNEK